MDALMPVPATSGASGGSPVTVHAPPPQQAAPVDVAPAPTAPHPPVEPLPALPAAVQRAHLEPPPAKLMTREEMLSLLQLAV
jgi:hypothetical protein